MLPLCQCTCTHTHTLLTCAQFSRLLLIQALDDSQNLVLLLLRKAQKNKNSSNHSANIYTINVCKLLETQRQKNRITVFKEVSYEFWALFSLQHFPLSVNHWWIITWKILTSHPFPLFGDRLPVPLVYHWSSFLNEDFWIYFSLPREGQSTISTHLLSLSSSGLHSTTYLLWHFAQKAKQSCWILCLKKLENIQFILFGKHSQGVGMAVRMLQDKTVPRTLYNVGGSGI
jgi:hypothetical protein